MGRWDQELVPLIPSSCKIFASAGAGFDWADVDVLAAKGRVSENLVAQITNDSYQELCIATGLHLRTPISNITRKLTCDSSAAASSRSRSRLRNLPHPRHIP